MRHVVAKLVRKHTGGLNESKDPLIYTHIPMYVSKANYFYPPYFGQPWTHLFDRLVVGWSEDMKQIKRVKVVKRRGQNEHLKQGDEQKQIYIL